MVRRFQNWLNALPTYADPVERRQAPLLQVVLLGLIVLGLVGLPILLGSHYVTSGGKFLGGGSMILCIVCFIVSLWLLRHERFVPSVTLLSLSLLVTASLMLVPRGLNSSWIMVFLLAFPIIFAGLLAPRAILWLTFGSTVLAVAIIGVLGDVLPNVVGYDAPGADFGLEILGSFGLLALFLCLCLDRFGSTLHDAVLVSQQRERELENVRATQEALINERTGDLRAALEMVEQREQQLAHTLADLRASQEAVREMSAPVLPVLPGVLVAPLVGSLDSERADVLTTNTLRAVEQQRAKHVIFDITGVPIVDTHVAHVLLQTARAAQLLGAHVLLVGVRPEVAQTMVQLGIDLGMFTTYADLRDALGTLL